TGAAAAARSVRVSPVIGAFRNDSHFAPRFDGAKEAAAIALVANARPARFDPDKQRVRIAIHANLADAQNVPAGFAFLPESVSRAAEKQIGRASCRERG